MSKPDTSGIEVSAKELVVALRREAALEPLRSFANTAEGHQALIRTCGGRVARYAFVWKPRACTAWTWRWL